MDNEQTLNIVHLPMMPGIQVLYNTMVARHTSCTSDAALVPKHRYGNVLSLKRHLVCTFTWMLESHKIRIWHTHYKVWKWHTAIHELTHFIEQINLYTHLHQHMVCGTQPWHTDWGTSSALNYVRLQKTSFATTKSPTGPLERICENGTNYISDDCSEKLPGSLIRSGGSRCQGLLHQVLQCLF